MSAPNRVTREEEMRARLLSFKNLKSNWDSYDAAAPTHETVDRAIRLMEILDWPNLLCAPNSDGGVTFMDPQDAELYITLNPGGDLEFEEQVTIAKTEARS